MWYCYILRNTKVNNITYNGSTNDPFRRLRQHNREITGGAKATGVSDGWEIYFLMTGFPTHNNALSCEWRIKHPTGKKRRPPAYSGVDGRIKAMNIVLNLDKWTSQCQCHDDITFDIYITKDVADNLDDLPDNFNLHIVDKITPETLG